MNILGVEVWIILALFTRYIICEWDTAYSPLYPNAYLKLSNNELLKVSNDQKYQSGDSITDIIASPTDGNYSITIANGDLYAFYEGDSKMSISRYDDDSDSWVSIEYNTTLKKNTNYEYYEDCTVMTSPNDDDDDDDEDGNDTIYIYGGHVQSNISSRILQFDPHKNTLNSVMTSITPTGFYGSANAILDSKSTANLLIGGRASSGWVSMFQSALWEYKSWSFKTVKSSSQSINSRIHPLALPIFPNDSSQASNVLIFGGILGPNLASPYILNLDVSDNDGWKWEDLTKKLDIQIENLLGGVVFNSTLFTITKDSKKRESGYSLNLYDTETFKTVESFDLSSSDSKSEANDSTQESSEVSEANQLSSAQSSLNSATSSLSTTTSSPSESIAHKSSTTSTASKAKIIVPAVVVPIVGIAIISIIVFFIYKKYTKDNSTNDQDSTNETDTEPDFYKEVNNLDNQSISSWNQKRNDYEKTRYQQQKSPIRPPTRSSTRSPIRNSPIKTSTIGDFTFDNTNIAKKLKRLSSTMSMPKTPKATTTTSGNHMNGPFANPEDYEDKMELSPISNHGYNNKSKISLLSSRTDTNSSRSDIDEIIQDEKIQDEESKIDQFLGNRDVQVLVSSQRRSKLRITNPDIESMESISEVESGSIIFDEKQSSLGYGDSKTRLVPDDDVFHDDYKIDDDPYVQEILRVFNGLGSDNDK